jgi:2-isopropylmalate synthase
LIRRPDGVLIQEAAIGDGAVDAIFRAVERVTGIAANLREFAVRGITAGKDAQGKVSLGLKVGSNARTFRGRAASTDIIEARLWRASTPTSPDARKTCPAR